MKQETFRFPSANGQKELHASCWLPEGPPKAVLQIAHGMAEHIARYDDFARFLVAQDIAVFGHDHAGHGKSAKDETEYGFFYEEDGWNQAVADIHELTAIARKRYPEAPLFLLGHSMGSFMARCYVLTYGNELAGAIFVGTMGPNPIAGLGLVAARFERWRLGPRGRSKLLDNLAFGSYNKAYAEKRTDSDWLSTDPAVVDAYIADPACGFLFTTSGMFDLLTGVRAISRPDWAQKVPKALPVLLVAGEQDPVGGMGQGVRKVAKQLEDAGVQTTLLLYPESRHEVLNEPNKEEVYQAIAAWVKGILDAG